MTLEIQAKICVCMRHPEMAYETDLETHSWSFLLLRVSYIYPGPMEFSGASSKGDLPKVNGYKTWSLVKFLAQNFEY